MGKIHPAPGLKPRFGHDRTGIIQKSMGKLGNADDVCYPGTCSHNTPCSNTSFPLPEHQNPIQVARLRDIVRYNEDMAPRSVSVFHAADNATLAT